MRRKTTKQSRGANAFEKRLIAWVKTQSCCVCANHPAHTEVDHLFGSACKHNRVLVGHLLILPLCERCHHIKTGEGQRGFFRIANMSMLLKWRHVMCHYAEPMPREEAAAIRDLYRQWDWMDRPANDPEG